MLSSKCLIEPVQEIFSRQACPEQSRRDAKNAKKKIFSFFSELGVLCVFARVIFFPIGSISNHSSAPGTSRQRFDVAHDIEDRRSVCSESLLQRAP